jgi:hypothetical protein
MQPYQLVAPLPGMTVHAVERRSDGAVIPFDGGNRDYTEYLAWVEQGNAADPPTPVPSQTGQE